MVDQPARKSLTFYRNRMFITVFIRPQPFFSWTMFVYSTPTYKTNFRPIFCIVILTTCKSSRRSFSLMFAHYNLGYLFFSSTTYIGCPRRNVPDFGKVFLMLKYTDKTQNTYVQIWDNGQRNLKLWQLLHTYWLPNSYWNWQEYVVSVILISVLYIKLTCEWHKAIKLNYKNTRTHVIVILTVPSNIHDMNAKHWPVLLYHQEGST